MSLKFIELKYHDVNVVDDNDEYWCERNQYNQHFITGYENALKDYQKKQIAQLNALIVLLLSDLTVGDRQKIMTICTIDVHSRDVVAKLIVAKVETSNAFQWQSQLRLNIFNIYAFSQIIYP